MRLDGGMQLDPVDRLVLDEWDAAGGASDRVVVVDAPELAAEVAARGVPTLAFCDDIRDERRLPHAVTVVTPDAALSPAPTVALLRLPKALGALDEVAGWLARDADPDLALFAGGRIKHLTRGMNDVLARHFAEVSASLGRQKSRVLRGRRPTPAPVTWPRSRRHDDLDLTVSAHGATFAGAAVDPGTRLLLASLDAIARDPAERAADIGSGNGVIAVLLARRLPGAAVDAVDTSWAGVEATRETAAANGVDLTVHRADGLAPFPDHSLDLVVTNPPFHVGTAKESTATLAMFADAARVLRPGGRFWCVFNSHLPWARALGDLGPTRIVTRSPKYTLTRTVAR